MKDMCFDIMGTTQEDAIVIERFCYSNDMGSFGVLTYKDFQAYTVERPWVRNKRFVSCIPEYDNYLVEFYNSPKFGRTLAITGDTVSLYPDPNFQRYAVLFHTANTMNDLQGCVGLGSSLGFVNNTWAVLNSRNTTNKFLSLVPSDKKIPLIIKQINKAVL